MVDERTINKVLSTNHFKHHFQPFLKLQLLGDALTGPTNPLSLEVFLDIRLRNNEHFTQPRHIFTLIF